MIFTAKNNWIGQFKNNSKSLNFWKWKTLWYIMYVLREPIIIIYMYLYVWKCEIIYEFLVFLYILIDYDLIFLIDFNVFVFQHNISPLHVAAKWGKNNMVKILLENSAQIDAKTRDGLTPLHCAARSGHEQVVSTLLENSAPISARTKVRSSRFFSAKSTFFSYPDKQRK